MSQVLSRKRPAPGASPILKQSSPAIGTPQMAPRQNVQWNTMNQPSTPSSFPDSATHYNPDLQSPLSHRSASNQVTRRAPRQDLAQPQRASYTNGNTDGWPALADDGMQQLGDGVWGNNGDDLDQKALIAQKDAQAKRKQIPPFVQKLSSFLDESRNTDLIRWSEDGNSFIVIDEDEFAKTLIPELFKHKNYASFVRQLNMYGFHKKVGLSDNSMRASERKNKTPSEYSNPYFKRGRPNLLWLIHKPKNPLSKAGGRGARGRPEDGGLDEEVEEVYDMDQPSYGNQAAVDATKMRQGRQPLMIGNGGSSQDLAAVHEELQTVRKQQQMIANLLQKTRAEHEQLYGQAANFQKLHDRHESSINAILTFLATVYSRNLEGGEGGPNFGGMFGSISQNPQEQGNVVHVGDYGDQNSQNQGNFRKQRLLLKAPPANKARSVASSVGSPGQQTQLHPEGSGNSGSQEMLDSNELSPSPQTNPDAGNGGSEADILSLIQSSNANQPYYTGSQMNFPEALSHLQTADGHLPLTANQRNDALRLMASTAGNASSDLGENALTSSMPTMAQYQQSKERLDQLSNALKEQDTKVNQLSNTLAPLSPSGSIPGMSDVASYGDPGANDVLDLDQIFNSGDYFNENAGGDFSLGNNDPLPDFNFDTDDAKVDGAPFLFDGAADEDDREGSAVETVNSSETAPSPAKTVDESNTMQEDSRDSRKRRRKG